MILPSYDQFGGSHNEFAALKNALAYQGVVARETGQPVDEALLFGIGAGIGASYFSFKYEGHAPTLSVNLVGRYRAGYGELMKRTLERLGLAFTFRQTGSAKAALGHLKQGLANGQPVTMQLMAPLPHRPLQQVERFAEEALVIYGLDVEAGNALAADVSPRAISLELEQLLAAWSAFSPLKHLNIAVAPSQVNLAPAVAEGIRQCAATLLDPPTPKGNFGLNGLAKWADLLVDKGPRGWLALFQEPGTLYQGLASVFAQIELLGNGAGMRATYAGFLEQSAALLAQPDLAHVSGQYRHCASLWSDLAEAALPDSAAPLSSCKALMRQKRALYLAQGTAALEQLKAIDDEQTALARSMAADFPLSPPEQADLLAHMREKLLELIPAERAAALALQAAAGSLT